MEGVENLKSRVIHSIHSAEYYLNDILDRHDTVTAHCAWTSEAIHPSNVNTVRSCTEHCRVMKNDVPYVPPCKHQGGAAHISGHYIWLERALLKFIWVYGSSNSRTENDAIPGASLPWSIVVAPSPLFRGFRSFWCDDTFRSEMWNIVKVNTTNGGECYSK